MTDNYGKRVNDAIERARSAVASDVSEQTAKYEIINPVLQDLTVPQLRAVWVSRYGASLPRGWSKASVLGALRSKILAELADAARTARRMARLPERQATVEAANRASASYGPGSLQAMLTDLASQADSSAATAALRGDREGAKYAQGLRDAYGTAATLAGDREARRITPRPPEPGPTVIDVTDVDEQSADDYAAIERGEL